MEKRTMGSLMAALRKSKGMTQQDVAEKLGVSNKSVSKWECDDGYPDISMLPAIAEIYGVTVDELLKGEIKNEEKAEKAYSPEKSKKQIDLILKNAFVRFKNMSVIAVVLALLSVVLGIILKVILNYFIWDDAATLIGLGVSLIISVVALLIEWFAVNKLNFSLNCEDAAICEESVIAYLKTARKYITAVITLSLVGIFANAAAYIASKYNEIESTWAAIGALLAIIISFFIFFALGNKLFGIVDNEEIQKRIAYGKKTVRGILIGTVCIVLVLSTSIGVSYKISNSHSYTFKSKANYDDFLAFVEESRLPLIEKDYEKLTVTVANIRGYEAVWGDLTVGFEEPSGLVGEEPSGIPFYFYDCGECTLDVLIYTFESKEAMDSFIENYCISSDFLKETSLELLRLCRNYVSYDGKDLTVKYKTVSNFSDILPLCVISVLTVCSLFAAVFATVRKKKFKS